MKIIFTLALWFMFGYSLAQQVPHQNQFFANPYALNPAMVASDDYMSVSIMNRRQWMGISDAPVSYSLLFQLPFKENVNLGAFITHEQFGLFTNSRALFTFGYKVPLAYNQNLRFGLSAGAHLSGYDRLNSSNPDDPAALIYENRTNIDGNFGVHYNIGNFNLGVTLPKILFQEKIYITETDTVEDQYIHDAIGNISYRFNFGEFAFEPHVLYHIQKYADQQFEAYGLFHYKDVAYFGGSYRQDFGPSFYAGFNHEQFSFGYAYELSGNQVTGLGNGTHELMLRLRVGDKKFKEKAQPTVSNYSSTSYANETYKAAENSAEVASEAPPKSFDASHIEVPTYSHKHIKAKDDDLVGHYVAIGSYASKGYAEEVVEKAKGKGYSNAQYFKSKANKMFYVYILKSQSLDEVKLKWDETIKDPEYAAALVVSME